MPALLSLIATGLTTLTGVRAQAPTRSGIGCRLAVRRSCGCPAIPGLNDVLATVTVGNQTEKVTKGELIELPQPLSDPRR